MRAPLYIIRALYLSAAITHRARTMLSSKSRKLSSIALPCSAYGTSVRRRARIARSGWGFSISSSAATRLEVPLCAPRLRRWITPSLLPLRFRCAVTSRIFVRGIGGSDTVANPLVRCISSVGKALGRVFYLSSFLSFSLQYARFAHSLIRFGDGHFARGAWFHICGIFFFFVICRGCFF